MHNSTYLSITIFGRTIAKIIVPDIQFLSPYFVPIVDTYQELSQDANCVKKIKVEKSIESVWLTSQGDSTQ